MAYIDGLVAPVLAGRRDDYLDMARAMAPVFLDHGALQVVETLSDNVPEGKITDMWRAVQADQPGGETLNFSWIVWPSKEARIAGWEKVTADERMKPMADMPFDAKRMIFGGFEVVLDVARDGGSR